MHIIAFIIALIAGVISFLQGGCGTLLGGFAGGLGNAIGGYEGRDISSMGAAIGGGGIFLAIASIMAIVGGSLSLGRKRASYILLFISGIIALLVGIVAFQKAPGLNKWDNFWGYGGIWGACYFIASIFAAFGYDKGQEEDANNSKAPSVIYMTVPEDNIRSKNSNAQNQNTPDKNFAPVLGLDNNSLVKRAMLFLEDGEFKNAEQYFNQALNQDAEDARVHFGLLLLQYNAHNAQDLLYKISTPLENEKLFQRALRFADGDFKNELVNYAKIVAEKFEQQRIQKETAKENRYQEILKAKANASTVEDFNALIRMLNDLRPYKDTNAIYDEVLKMLGREQKYQDTIKNLEQAKYSHDFIQPIEILKTLGDYKDAQIFLTKAEAQKQELELKERKRNRNILIGIILAVLAVLGYYIGKGYIEKSRAEAKIQAQQNILTAFFEERYDEAQNLIKNIPDYEKNILYLGITAYTDYLKNKIDYSELAQIIDSIFYSSGRNILFSPEAKSTARKYETKPAQIFWGDAEQNRFAFKIHADNGDKYAMFRLVEIYGSENDKNNTAVWLKKLVENGTPIEKTQVANLFYKGELVQQDYKQAYELYLQAAENGDAEAQNNLGWFYQRGFYVKQDYAQAFNWYKKAAEQGMAVAQENIAYSYEAGRGVKQNYNEAFKWYQQAAEQGREFSQYKLGECYSNGNGTKTNLNQAFNWYKKSAEQNYAPALHKLGWCYQRGLGVNIDYDEAMSLYKKSAEQNNSKAMAAIGMLYYEGLGVQKDLNEALSWYKKALENGNKDAEKIYNQIERELLKSKTREIISQMEREKLLPVSAVIYGDKVNLRYSANVNSNSLAQLNSGHPVSISKRQYTNGVEWYLARTASGSEGWVNGDYVSVNPNTQDDYENNKRKKSLPAKARVIQGLNVRDIPAVQGSIVVDKLYSGAEIYVYEIFAGAGGDWFKVETDGGAGWIFGKYIDF